MTGTLDRALARPGDAQARVADIVNTHGPALLRVAQRVSLCSDDAHDAVQRALEIYWRRLDSLDPVTEAAWLRVVVRNEALAVRKSRQESVAGEDLDLDLYVSEGRSVEDRVASSERVERSAEALRHLKRDEATALLLKAEGHSYEEISAQLDWSRTKVNRAITEGRARFFKVFRGIEAGEQCERFAPALARLAAGDLPAEDLLSLRPHLRHCHACRASVRGLHTSRQRVAAFLALPAFLRPSQIRAELYGLLGRFGGADPALAAAGGSGGRGIGAAAIVGLCLGGAGAGGYCVATGKLPDPIAIVRAQKPAAEKRESKRAAATATAAPQPASPVARAPVQAPVRSAPRPTARRERTTPRKQAGEFAFESGAPARTAPSAATPSPSPSSQPQAKPAASSGGEFAFEQ